ncbi:isocitrate lyase/phosphoenolpyruvate mutase family protein [Nonomuraea sp. MG754425]|uniref:isocitrate lyase/phosphoenolpyruvate mutase family protein n=1 Tax=Nonomuraea sp. MG754425 TaxID=2570319 RepID=UPI001F25CBE0|nr:isocitrate lyase/phosphoenolpyruvate mutase family protein [Nonomuraea sp. MG754425]
MSPSTLRAALRDRPLLVPGCHDPLSARMAATAGARAVFVSGGAVGRALFDEPMIPRWGADTYLSYVRLICRSSPVPVIVDGEDGFGDPAGLCAEATDAGAAAIVIGDSRPDGTLLPATEFADLIAEARSRSGLLFVARSDGLEHDRAGTAERLGRYHEAGAELTMPLLNSVLRTESGDRLLGTVTELAAAARGSLAVHSRLGHELPPHDRLPGGVAAVLVTAISVPPSADHLRRLLTQR